MHSRVSSDATHEGLKGAKMGSDGTVMILNFVLAFLLAVHENPGLPGYGRKAESGSWALDDTTKGPKV